MTTPFPLSGTGRVRWRAALPGRHVGGVSVAADGMAFVTTESGLIALDGPETRWTAETAGGCVLLDGGLLVTSEAGGYAVREQRTGAAVGEIEGRPLSAPMPLAGGVLVFLTAGSVLRATTLTGEPRWSAEVPTPAWPLVWQGTVFVAELAAVRAFDAAGGPLWRVDLTGELDGSLVGLPDGKVLVPVRGDDHIGFLELDPQGNLRRVPAHLPPGELVVPLPTGRLALPGWPERDNLGERHPTVTIVEVETGAVLQHHRVPADVHGLAAGTNGLIAVAGSPTWEYWTKYHGRPGFDLRESCYVWFLDEQGVRVKWTAGSPITGPVAIAANGDLLVPLPGELISLG
ncbi:PQQ-binding-like beta-propeller repeat protein [Amycolatopsis sp. cmx-4-68]|uniref:outer membrane protein assembly factor BamB family protein n=1 Tax=Amycolatopsis sp. cmx-4-68 TaxID=2790938 RepID=UPI00397D7966